MGSMRNTATPTLVRGPWLKRELVLGDQQMETKRPPGVSVGVVFAGGDHSFVRLTAPGEQVRV